MRKRIAVIAVSAIGLALPASTGIGEGSTNTQELLDPCAKRFGQSDIRPVAHRAWKRPYGPTAKQIATYQLHLACSHLGQRGFIKAVWLRKRKSLAPVREMRRIRGRCSDYNTKPCIQYAAHRFDQDYGKALQVASDESGLRACPPENPTHFGMWQFDSATWEYAPWHHRHPCEPLYASLAAMWYWARGEEERWVTY